MKKIIFVFAMLLTLSMFMAACNETDISRIVKNLPDVQQFMQEHPSADMKIVYLGDSVIATKINDIRVQCTEDVPQVAMYYVEFKEGTNTDMKLWLDANTQQLLCALKKGVNDTLVPVAVSNQTSVVVKNETLIVDEILENRTGCTLKHTIVMTVGETTMFDLDGVPTTIKIVSADAQQQSAIIAVNDKSKQMSMGETSVIGGMKIYVVKIIAAPVGKITTQLSVVDNCVQLSETSIHKTMMEGDVAIFNVSGNQIAVGVEGLGKDASPMDIMFTVSSDLSITSNGQLAAGESKGIKLGDTGNFGIMPSGVWIYVKRIFPSYTNPIRQGAVEFFIGNGSSIKIVSEEINFVNIKDEEVRICSKDSDCFAVNADKCGCYAGGKATSINKNHINYWNVKVPLSDDCVKVISQDISCASEPKCVSGSCNLVVPPVAPPNNETNGIRKIMTAGDTTTIDICDGKKLVVGVVNINADTSPPSVIITINGESKQMIAGQTENLDGARMYAKNMFIFSRSTAIKADSVELIFSVDDCSVSEEKETCSIYKDIMAGDTETFNIGKTPVVAYVIGIDTDASPAFAIITVNGETKQITFGETTLVGGIKTNLSLIYPYTVPAKQQPAGFTFSVDNCSTSELSDEELRACSQDSDCINVRGDNCGCTAGGTATSINKKYQNYWNEKVPGGTCIAVMSQDWSCGRSINPKCINNLCTLNETNYQQKIMTAGDTATLDVKGTQAVVSMVGVNTDTKSAMITVNGESKQLSVGETAIFGEIKVYVNQVSSYSIVGMMWAELFISKNSGST